MHDVDAGEHAGHLEVLKQRGKQLGMAWVLSRQLNGGDDAANVQVPPIFALLAEAQHLYRVLPPSSPANSRVRYSTCTPAPP